MKKGRVLLVAALAAIASDAFADDFAWPQMAATSADTIVSQAETAVAGDVLLTQQAQVQDVVLLHDHVSAEVRFMDNFTVDVDLPARTPLYAMQLGWGSEQRVYCAMIIVPFEAEGRPAFARACLSDDNSDGTFDNIWVIPSRNRPARVGGGPLVDTRTSMTARFQSVAASTIEPITLQIVYGGLQRIELLGGNNFPVRVLEDGEPVGLGYDVRWTRVARSGGGTPLVSVAGATIDVSNVADGTLRYTLTPMPEGSEILGVAPIPVSTQPPAPTPR